MTPSGLLIIRNAVLLLILWCCGNGAVAQIRTTTNDSVKVALKKYGRQRTESFSYKDIYELTIINNTDSAICLLSSGRKFRTDPDTIQFLDPGGDDEIYYSLEYCKAWDAAYLRSPAAPVMISAHTSFKTLVSPKEDDHKKNTFHVHFAFTDKTYQQILGWCAAELQTWQYKLNLLCKKTAFPE